MTQRGSCNTVEPGLITCIDVLVHTYTLVSGTENHSRAVHSYSEDATIQNILLTYTWIRSLCEARDQPTDELFMYPNKPVRYWSYQPGHKLHDTPHKIE